MEKQALALFARGAWWLVVATRNPTVTPPSKRKLERLDRANLSPEKRERIEKLTGPPGRGRRLVASDGSPVPNWHADRWRLFDEYRRLLREGWDRLEVLRALAKSEGIKPTSLRDKLKRAWRDLKRSTGGDAQSARRLAPDFQSPPEPEGDHPRRPRAAKTLEGAAGHAFGENMHCETCGVTFDDHEADPALCPRPRYPGTPA